MNLSQEDIERYRPYHNELTPPRACGALRIMARRAYDRGAECAMRHQRTGA
jgi:hypothetical protein